MQKNMLRLTDEGRLYLEEGLPEKRLIRLLLKGAAEPEKAKRHLGSAFSVALQWAKKYGAVEIREGRLFLLKQSVKETAETEKALQDVAEGKEISAAMAALLLQRKLAEYERETAEIKAKKLAGSEVANLTEDLIKTGRWRDVTFRKYNVSVPGKKIHIGKGQPYNSYLRDVRRKLVEMGFVEMAGPAIETEFWNFDALYQPQNHPSRDWTQTYSLKYPTKGRLPDRKIVQQVAAAHENGWKTGSIGWRYKWSAEKAAQLMPRAHDTAISPRYMAKGVQIPGKYFSIVRCFRPDIIDATHGVEFNHMGGFVIAEDLNFRDMLGLLKMFASELAGAEEVRFYADYYPFTEPSVQISAKHPQLGWLELAGAGIFREELTKPLGIDVPVLAWGFGIDRLAMHKLGIKDIRNLFSRNLEWLRNQVVV